jgi:uncharacterized protein
MLPLFPFDANRYIGTISEVSPRSVKVNLPNAAAPDGQSLYGHRLGGGEVGEFVFIECGGTAVFGRVIAIRLPEKERLAVERELGRAAETHPIGTIQLLTTIDIGASEVLGGISTFPRLGSRVYSAHPQLIRWIAEFSRKRDPDHPSVRVTLATLQSDQNTVVGITPERLFGRHCAILGATGGGKSWTVARLLEQAATPNAKIILLDATGEFHTLRSNVRHVYMGHGSAQPSGSSENVLPYSSLTESDLFSLFKPSGQSQAPKLRAAMKSLKAQKAAGRNGPLRKANQARGPIAAVFREHARAIELPRAEFELHDLVRQIQEECVYHSDRQGSDHFGDYNESERSYCTTLVTRIEDMIAAPELACIFRPEGRASVLDTIDQFLKDPTSRVLRISLRHLPFAYNAREIVANAIGRHLLAAARHDQFRDRPVVVCLDEAHQFLDKTLGDESSRYALDAFELIAKEGRKYCLTICIATQRPRDIPEGVLSQMGTLIVHRLINDRDREVVERASGDIDRSAAEFLPTLAAGEAVVIGVDFPIPLTIQVLPPASKPDSRGPDFQTHWR